MKYFFPVFAFLASISAHFPAFANIEEGLAKPWQLGFSLPATPVMEQLYNIHDLLLIIITLISLFVLVLLIYICVRFRRGKNPVASKTAHNTKLEIIWTVIPIFILIAIAIPSLRIHYFMQVTPEAEMTLKVTGYQWYWHYDYPDYGNFGFDSVLTKEEELKPGDHRLLAVDNHVVVPVDTVVHVQMTAADVIHAWAVPTFGIKRDAVPGLLNETWFKATKTGRFFGQCSELCGVGHGFMPIVVDVVEKEEFMAWVAAKQTEAGIPVGTNTKDTPPDNALPLTDPVSAEQENPLPVIEKEKEMSDKGDKKPDPKKAAQKANDKE